ncbi:uncharacterized protein LOC119896177 [Micropterus salmoides]|uniref:uncharacterized protein LOC119896177 n=1 Tax=Micropterus salmoides TaxID=27706 RepID=UPI0018EC161F|nr:uncharacterized protein LOC119896177 [Micropterus salmoides]
MLEQGYAEKVPTNEPTLEQGKVWYIPHHGVRHPTKGKLRVVFDCGCTYKGISLNSQLLQGPDFTNTLIGVLLRFREEPIAVMADINAMFHQEGILSVVSSLYDPLGFLSPFIIPAKLLLQELCRMNFKWDEPVPRDVSEHGLSGSLNFSMSGFKVERCIKPKNFGTQVKAELHHFSDASQTGYGTVSYLRLESTDNVHVSFITGKARVAPLKQLTIPRLELAAAVLAVRVNTMLLKELQLPLQRSVFWTDSTTVLKYIFNETKRFHTYVANRVSTIRESTDKDQWRYVNTKDNPADEASRGLRAQVWERKMAKRTGLFALAPHQVAETRLGLLFHSI